MIYGYCDIPLNNFYLSVIEKKKSLFGQVVGGCSRLLSNIYSLYTDITPLPHIAAASLIPVLLTSGTATASLTSTYLRYSCCFCDSRLTYFRNGCCFSECHRLWQWHEMILVDRDDLCIAASWKQRHHSVPDCPFARSAILSQTLDHSCRRAEGNVKHSITHVKRVKWSCKTLDQTCQTR